MSERKAYLGVSYECEDSALVYATTRGKARAQAASMIGVEFTDSDLQVRRYPRADAFAKLRDSSTLADLRACGFTDETGRRCHLCDLGDPSDGGEPAWTLCDECGACAGCGHGAGCRTEQGANYSGR
jgi:hypothetical protein